MWIVLWAQVVGWIAAEVAAEPGDLTLIGLLPFVAQTGVFGGIVWAIVHLHRDAVEAHDQRAADWKTAHDAQVARNAELQGQLNHIYSALTTMGKPP